MNGFGSRLAALIALGAAAFCCMSCSSNAQTVTDAQEKAWKNPPKNPPPEYKGNVLGTPGAPPKSGAQGAGTAGGNPPAVPGK